MNHEELINLFKEKGALWSGHFELASKRHSPQYMQCALLLQYPDVTRRLCEELAKSLKGYKIDVVAGPAIGGIIIAYEMARVLGVRAIYAERKEKLELRRNFELTSLENVLLVEDVITTGGSILELAHLCEVRGAKVAAFASLVDRTGGKNRFGYPLYSLLTLDIPTYEANECPLCRDGVPIVKPGSQKLCSKA